MASGATWRESRAECESLGGHLATVTSLGESDAIAALGDIGDFWLGGFQNPGSGEPAEAWQWVTEEPWLFSRWSNGQPDDQGGEDVLSTYPGQSLVWNDRIDCQACSLRGFIIEWDSDCNGDGIVDYGRCRDGSLPDINGDNNPDCCEGGRSLRYPRRRSSDRVGRIGERSARGSPRTVPIGLDRGEVLSRHRCIRRPSSLGRCGEPRRW